MKKIGICRGVSHDNKIQMAFDKLRLKAWFFITPIHRQCQQVSCFARKLGVNLVFKKPRGCHL